VKIRSLTAFQVPIGLRKPVRHASHVRSHNDTLVVRCELSDGHIGWGEGLPRPYVTGESIESVWQHLEQTSFASLADEFKDAREASDMFDQFVLASVDAPAGVVPRECFGNAVRCGLEVAILDAACQAENQSVGDFIASLPEAAAVIAQRDEVFYSTVITSMTARKQWLSAWKMRLFGFGQVKVKVGTEGIDDRACLRRIWKVVGPDVDLRLDANEAWTPDEVLSKMEPLLPFNPTSLEQPVQHEDVAGLADVRRNLSVPIMLDESLCSEEDGKRAITQETCDLFNIRLSKCGGIRSSIRLAAMANANGLGYQLGCQVGETGILSAAGRHFACNVNGIRYLEGSYDRFLVREALTRENLTFARKGRAPRLPGPGLGINVNEARVRAIAERKMELISGHTA
jgi:L-alanine-DL-glutamate epimerase-like enolase superfamily enzyme